MDPLIFKFQNKCNLVDEYKKYSKFKPKYEDGKFPHHSSNVYHHSIWSARRMEWFWDQKNHWININLIQKINKKYKNLSIFLAFFHDIGKIDGRINKLIKPNHPTNGYNMIYNQYQFFNKGIFSCIQSDLIDNEYQIHKITSILALISLCHQDLGEIMQGKMTVNAYLDKFISYMQPRQENFILYQFQSTDYKLILILLILVSLADVMGARPIVGKSKIWNILNQDIKIKNDPHGAPNPWDQYQYDKNKKVQYLIKNILDNFTSGMNKVLNTMKTGIVNENIKTHYDIKRNPKSKQIYKLKVGKIEKGTLLYKAMDVYITQEDHKNYKTPSWFASSHTAESYITTNENNLGGSYKYIFEVEKDIKSVLIINPKNINTLYQMIYDNNDWGFEQKKNYLHLLQFAFGINASYELQEKLHIKFFGVTSDGRVSKKINISHKDTMETADNRIKRWSYHELDMRIMKEIICFFGFDGYMAPILEDHKKGKFHEEIGLCESYKNTKINRLEKIINKSNNEILNNTDDMIKYIRSDNSKFMNSMDVDNITNEERKHFKKGYQLGGKNRKNKKIRKHRGINQNTGNLNKGYKYSKKILKNGLKQIVKK